MATTILFSRNEVGQTEACQPTVWPCHDRTFGPADHGDGKVTTFAVAGLGRRPSFYVVPHGRHRSAPCMMAPLTGLVHDRQSAADYENSHNKNNQ
jgi:hypothetical protein